MPEGGEREWNVSETSTSRYFRRLDTFKRFLAYARGSDWRGYRNYVGAEMMYPEYASESIEAVMQSEAVNKMIQLLARRRARQLLEQVQGGYIDSELVSLYLQYAHMQHMPQLPATAHHNLVRWTTYVGEEDDVSRPFDSVVFYTAMRHRVERVLKRRARAMIERSVARIHSPGFTRAFAAVVHEMLASMYHQGTLVNMEQVMELRRVAEQAAIRRQSILFVPCHKSHIDYLVLSWLMFRVGISLPHIIAGDNLDLPIIGSILRAGGAFFIRRSFQEDQLYPVVIKEYIMDLLEHGKNIECFIEGTRSRTGKLLPPKYGILKYIVSALREHRTSDVLICPVSLQYDSVIESDTYAKELLGRPKQAESLYGLLSGGTSVLQLKMGRIDVRFKRPWSLADFLAEREEPACRRTAESENTMLKTLGYRILYDINSISVVMPAALVGTVLLTLRGRGIGRDDLIRGVAKLRHRVVSKGYSVGAFDEANLGDIVDRALTLMRGLVEIQRDLLEVTIHPVKRFELSFYRNQVIHIFVHEALLCVAFYTKLRQGVAATASRDELMDATLFISQVFRDEFVYGPTPLEQNIQKTLHRLLDDGVFELSMPDGEPAALEDFERGGARVGVSNAERELGRENLDMYLFLIWPYVETYWLAAITLFSLAPHVLQGVEPDAQMPLRELQLDDTGSTPTLVPWFVAKDVEARAQLIGKTLYSQGELSYYEAVNSATLANAFAHMEQMGIVVQRLTDEAKPVRLMALHPDWVPDTQPVPDGAELAGTTVLPDSRPRRRLVGRLVGYHEQLSQYRREGKDRRDQSISSKVLPHVYHGGPKVVEWHAVPGERPLKL